MVAAHTAHNAFAFGEISRIGPPRHTLRNVFVGLAAAIMTALLLVFYWPSSTASSAIDSGVAAELGQFREAMYNRCGGREFMGAASPRLVEIYAANPDMRSAVVSQFHMLQRDHTRCDDVMSALRTAGYPLQ